MPTALPTSSLGILRNVYIASHPLPARFPGLSFTSSLQSARGEGDDC